MDFKQIDEITGYRYSYSWGRVALLVIFYILTAVAIFVYWNAIYNQPIVYPSDLLDEQDLWYRRPFDNSRDQVISKISHDFRIFQLNNFKNQSKVYDVEHEYNDIKDFDGEQISPNKHIYPVKRLVCYYSVPSTFNKLQCLRLSRVNGSLCTHINIGPTSIVNNSIFLSNELRVAFNESQSLRLENPDIKLLIWVGGADSNGFVHMVKNHLNRKQFIHSLKEVLGRYRLDGVDLDWEFPSAYNRERQHFSQLLYEIRQEYIREKTKHLLTVAVTAIESIASFSYDAREINLYADFANVMAYDFHLFSKITPFTGLNAPLYARSNERSLLEILNSNYSVHFWLKSGLDRHKLVLGLPTYGHSFTLENPFNHGITSPASGFGGLGTLGFASNSQICWFKRHNIFLTTVFDNSACSPYMFAGNEWIAFENEESITCKTKYIVDNGLGGAMVFSLNTDDYKGYCDTKRLTSDRKLDREYFKFPLVQKVKDVLFGTKENL